MAKSPTTAVATIRPIDAFKKQLELAAPTIMKMVPAHVPYEKFQAMVVTAVAYNPDLLECTTASLLRATAEAAGLGLSLNPSMKEADILRVYNKKAGNGGAYEAQMRPRFGGLMKLARQSGDISKIESVIVYEKDFFKETRGLNPNIDHEPLKAKTRKQCARDLWISLKREPDDDEIDAEHKKHARGLKTHVYCMWELKDGTKQFEVMEGDDVERIRARSPAGQSGPWVSDEDEMWRKTVVRRASKYMPTSSEDFRRAVDIDNRADSEDQPVVGDYVDVTEPEAPAAGAPSESAQTQADKLAERVAPRATPLVRIDPLDGFDGPDYAAWRVAALVDYEKLSKADRLPWRKLHADVLRAAAGVDEAFVEGLGE